MKKPMMFAATMMLLTSPAAMCEDGPKVGAMLFCFSRSLRGHDVLAYTSHSMYRMSREIEATSARSNDEFVKMLVYEDIAILLESKTPVEVLGWDKELAVVKVLEGVHKDRTLRIYASGNLFTVAGIDAEIKRDRDIDEVTRNTLAKAKSKGKAMAASLADVEAGARKASEKASRPMRSKVYDRERKKGLAKMALEFGYDKFTDPEAEMMKFIAKNGK